MRRMISILAGSGLLCISTAVTAQTAAPAPGQPPPPRPMPGMPAPPRDNPQEKTGTAVLSGRVKKAIPNNSKSGRRTRRGSPWQMANRSR
jgi:hypothetical protein